MIDIVIVFDGAEARTLWTDAIDLRALGEIQEVPRASSVEFEGGEWVVRLDETGEEIARHPNRGEAIAAEVAWLQEHRL